MLTFLSSHQRGVSLLNRCGNNKVTVGSERLRFGARPRWLELGRRPGYFAISPLFVSSFSICHPTEGGYRGLTSNGACVLKIVADIEAYDRQRLATRRTRPHLSGWTRDLNLGFSCALFFLILVDPSREIVHL